MNNLVNNNIKNKIYFIRNKQVILDKDLAKFYQVKTKRLNEQVKRNIERFPEEFMFQLTEDEFENLRSQFATSSLKHGGRRYLPYVFTEQGVSMLSAILKSKIAIKISIQIINTFVDLRHFTQKNFELINEINLIKNKHIEYDIKFNQIFNKLENRNISKDKGIFFEGQLFDSYKFISDLIRKANKKIILIDNYIDDRTLNLFIKKKKEVQIQIYTKNISKILKQDLEKFNSQYFPIQIKEFNLSHDRFLIIDNEVYHIGASLKDLGLKWFGFSKMNKDSLKIIEKLNY